MNVNVASETESVSEVEATQRNAEQSIAFYNLAAEQGSSLAFVRIGDLYYYGLAGRIDDGSPNYKESFSYYSKASRLRNAQGRFNLGFMYEHGLGTKRDLHLAKRFYEETTSLDSESSIPVSLMVFKMRLCSAWVRLKCRCLGLPIPHVENMLVENGPAKKASKTGRKRSKDKNGKVLKQGNFVEARWRGKRKYYSGWVHHINDDGTFDVQYDDGDFEHNVPVSLIKRVSTKIHKSIKDEEARLESGGWFGGFISRHLPESYYDSDMKVLLLFITLIGYIVCVGLVRVGRRIFSCCCC